MSDGIAAPWFYATLGAVAVFICNINPLFILVLPIILGLAFRPVAADTGSIGGTGSHEFQVLAESGEDVIAYSDTSDYAANIELAPTLPLKGSAKSSIPSYHKKPNA